MIIINLWGGSNQSNIVYFILFCFDESNFSSFWWLTFAGILWERKNSSPLYHTKSSSKLGKESSKNFQLWWLWYRIMTQPCILCHTSRILHVELAKVLFLQQEILLVLNVSLFKGKQKGLMKYCIWIFACCLSGIFY